MTRTQLLILAIMFTGNVLLVAAGVIYRAGYDHGLDTGTEVIHRTYTRAHEAERAAEALRRYYEELITRVRPLTIY